MIGGFDGRPASGSAAPDNIFPFNRAVPSAPYAGQTDFPDQTVSFDAVDLIFNAITSMNLADFVRLQKRLNAFLDGEDA